MELLRMKGQLTRLLILRSMVLEDLKNGASIAQAVGITSQGTSEYLRGMEKEGLVHREGRTFKATAAGMEYLQGKLLSLKGFVDTSIGSLEIIRSTDAISDGDIRRGTRVNLYMRGGLLYAGMGPGTSSGVAETDARAGDMVQVGELSGVVDMKFYPLRLVQISPARSGGAAVRLGSRSLRSLSRDNPGSPHEGVVIAALDMESAAMLLRSNVACQLEMPSDHTIAGYVKRGRAVLAFGTPHSCRALSEHMEREHRDIEVVREEAMQAL